MSAGRLAVRVGACTLACAAGLAWVTFQPSKSRATADSACSATVETDHSSWPPVALVPSRSGGCPGYWIVSSDGGIFTFGGAPFYGSTGALKLNKPIIAMASTPSGAGYWLVASDGGIFTFGDAAFFGSTGAMPLNKPIVAMASTPDGRGYWLVASDGGIFTFGDAAFFGSTGAMSLNKPIVGMASTADGRGYWLVASDGGIFTFGDAPFYGSTGAMKLNRPIVAMAEDPATGGYWLVASDGGVFSFDAPFLGSMGGTTLRRPVIGAADVDGGGYDMLGADGGVFNFGDAPFYGTAPGPSLAGTVIAVDPGHDGGNGSAPGVIDHPVWNGRADEPCDTAGSQTASGYPEHLFTWEVAQYLEADLHAQGATVVLTRQNDDGVGPCVDQRAAIGNDADANAAISIHADGGPPGGRGFTVLYPVADGIDNAIVGPSENLAVTVRDAFASETDEPVSDYYGTDGIEPRDDLGGLNLSTVPKVLIECANMQNATDAALLVQPSWQQQAAAAIAGGLSNFVAAG